MVNQGLSVHHKVPLLASAFLTSNALWIAAWVIGWSSLFDKG